MKKTFFSTLFIILLLPSFAQLAKLTKTSEQQYRLNVSRAVIFNPFKHITSVILRDVISDNNGGYLKFTVLKGNYGGTKHGAYVHFAKLDEKLNIKSESEVGMVTEGSENIVPVTSFSSKNRLNLIMAGPTKAANSVELTYWQFDLSTLSLVDKSISLVSLPLNEDKKYDFESYEVTNGKGFVVTMVEVGGKKDNVILYHLHFDNKLSLTAKTNTTLPYLGKEGSIITTVVNNAGTVFSLLSYPDEKDDEIIVNSLLVASKQKSQVIPLTHKEDVLINCAIGLNTAGQLLLSGLTRPYKKDYTTGLVLNKISDEGKIQLLQEEMFQRALLDKLEETEKKGLKINYYVRSVSERENGVVDVVINFCRDENGYSGGNIKAYTYSTKISDALIYSFEKGRLASMLPIKRNMDYYSTHNGYSANEQFFSFPKVFTANSDLYLIYFDNPQNTIGGTSLKKPKWCDFTKGSLVLAKIDKNYQPVLQELVQFERGGDFRQFFETAVYEIESKKYVVSTDKFKALSKNVKTTSILVEVQ